MDALMRYSFTVYLRKTQSQWVKFGNCPATIPGIDVAITLFAKDFEDAINNIPEDYEKWKIYRVDYPTGVSKFQHFRSVEKKVQNKLRLVK